MTVKSPGGSNFPYYYKGGEIHCLKYGSFFADEARLLQVMEAEEAFLKERPAQRHRVWVDFYETALTDGVVSSFADHISALREQVVRLAIVGCPLKSRNKLKRALKSRGLDGIPCRFFADPEDAKTWLVSQQERR